MWLFDFGKKNRLLEWQNTLLETPVNRLVMNEQTLKMQTQARIENDIRIVQDCVRILGSTTKVDVFFSRLQLMEERTKDMVLFEKYDSFSNAKPSEALNEFYRDKQECIYQFLIRYFGEVFDKAEKLKTEKGKRNQFQKFYDSLQEYYVIMNDNNIYYIEEKYNQHK